MRNSSTITHCDKKVLMKRCLPLLRLLSAENSGNERKALTNGNFAPGLFSYLYLSGI